MTRAFLHVKIRPMNVLPASLSLYLALATAVLPGGMRKAPPDFQLRDIAGKTVSLSEFKSVTPVLLVFYRGYW